MKKFKFTLQSVFDYIQTVEKSQKADLNNAMALVRQLYEQMRMLDEAYERNLAAQREALKKNIGLPEELNKYDAYFRYIRDSKKELLIKIKKAEDERDRCRERLIATRKQINTYAKLRDEQYMLYLKEQRSEEEKEIGDLISFNEASDLAEKDAVKSDDMKPGV
jgi:flagellar export protein FliJ